MEKLFSDIYGQKSAVRILAAQLENGRVGHAYLILGNEGIGKNYLARRFINYLLCDNSQKDSCQNCNLYLKGNHPDFIFIDGKNGIRIDEIRNLIARLNLSPNLSKRKVALITHAENMGLESANAILKTLEEPPLDSVVILTSISTRAIPETIVSRVQQISLKPLTSKDISKIIKKETGQKFTDDLFLLAAGNIGEAKKIISDDSYKKARKKFYDAAETLLFSDSIVEKFKILEEFDKSENLLELVNLLFYFVSESLDNPLNKKSKTLSRIRDEISVLGRTKILINMLKIYQNMKYNVNLRLSLEGLLLEQCIHD